MIGLANYLGESARRWPERTAVVDGSGQTLSYSDLDRLASAVTAHLRALGIGPGDRVGFLLPKRCEVLAVMFGALRAGAAYVPLNREAGEGKLRKVVDDAAMRTIFVDDEGHHRLRTAGIGTDTVVLPPTAADSATAFAASLRDGGVADVPDPGPDDLAYLLYTSGSTGTPKGVRISHGNAVSFVEWAATQFAITEQDRIAGHAPLHFDLSVFDVFAGVRCGAALHLVPEQVAVDPRVLPTFITENRITVWYAAPSVLGMTADRLRRGEPGPPDLRLVLFAGEVFPVDRLRALTRAWPDPEYYNLYGPTETNVCTFARIPLPVPDDRTDPYPIGDACPHCAVMVVDDDLRPVSSGESGTLCVAGPSVTSGYWGTTAHSRFFDHAGQRWYLTGDIVRESPDGLVFLGRRDRMVKRRGHRIELDEVEHALRRNPAVSEAAVVADSAQAATITAFVVARSPVTQIGLRTHCRTELGAHSTPDRFVIVDHLPLTSTGKTDYQGLNLRCTD